MYLPIVFMVASQILESYEMTVKNEHKYNMDHTAKIPNTTTRVHTS